MNRLKIKTKILIYAKIVEILKKGLTWKYVIYNFIVFMHIQSGNIDKLKQNHIINNKVMSIQSSLSLIYPFYTPLLMGAQQTTLTTTAIAIQNILDVFLLLPLLL